MPTPKSLRSAPANNFEDYTVVKFNVGKSLRSVHSNVWTKVTSLAPLPSATAIGYTSFINLPFSFPFNGLSIKRIILHSSGWIGLEDPASGYVIPNQLADDLIQSSYDYDPSYINNTTLSNILIAPWFTFNGAVAYSSIEEYGTTGMGFDETTKSLIRNGLSALPHNLDPDGGIKYTETLVENKRCFIVRWTVDVRCSTVHSPNFECVLYENGRIEFNYGKISFNTLYSFFAPNPERVFSGIFAPGSNKFRDLSDQPRYSRPVYELGGHVYNAAFSDGSDPYVTSLTYNDWPGEGTRITFLPPQLRKRDLPRKQSDNRFTIPSNFEPFNDKKSFVFSTKLVEFPSMLPRDIKVTNNDEIDVLLNFTGRPSKNTSITGNFPSYARQFDDRLGNLRENTNSSPFVEKNLYELDYASNDFYAAGSLIEDVGPGFDESLKNKKKLTYNFYVNHKTNLPVTSSTILYFNKNIGRFEAIAPSDLRNAAVDTFTSPSIPYDYRGFTPIGTFLASGSVYNQGSGSIGVNQFLIPEMVKSTGFNPGITYNAQNETYYVSQKYNKNITTHSQYDSEPGHVIEYTGDEPFLVEKIVVQLPIEYGPGWYADKTTARPLSGSTAVDLGGPALTVSLMNEVQVLSYVESISKVSANNTLLNYNYSPAQYTGFDGKTGTVRYRDIIASGSITHSGDIIASSSVGLIYGSDNQGYIDLVGFNAFGAKPAKVLQQNLFSGSITVELDAATSHGTLVCLSVTGSSAFWSTLVSREQISINNSTGTPGSVQNSIFYVNPIGRSKTGDEITGRSIFGKEFSVNLSENDKTLIKNPWYLSSQSDRSYFQSRILTRGSLIGSAIINREKTRKSPYLLTKGDRLILSISKTRPVSYVTSSYYDGRGHDISLSRGDLSITLYGTSLVENLSHNSAINNAIIGNTPVVDQFELYSNKSFYHTYTDHLMDGKMGRLWGSITYMPNLATPGVGFDLIPGNTRTRLSNPHYERFRIFSKTRGIEYLSPPYGEFISEERINYNFSNEYMLYAVPSNYNSTLYTRLETLGYLASYCGLQNTVTHTVDDSYVYDSLVPDINDINKVDTGTTFIKGINSPDSVGLGPFGARTQNLPVMLLDCSSRKLTTDAKAYVNNDWSKAFPFEERYENVQRIVRTKFKSRDTGTMAMSLRNTFPRFDNPLLKYDVDPINLSITGSSGLSTSERIVIATLVSSSSSDSRPFEYNEFQGQGWQLYEAATYFDSNKLLFGFGDVTYRMKDASGTYAGSTNLPKPLKDISPIAWVYVASDHVSTLAFEIRGWKYGLHSGNPRSSTYKFRRNSYGQLRDMLEQTYDTKMFSIAKNLPTTSPVQVQFIDPKDGGLTSPELTHSLNLSPEAASSTPYFDGQFRSRPDDPDVTLNTYVRYP